MQRVSENVTRAGLFHHTKRSTEHTAKQQPAFDKRNKQNSTKSQHIKSQFDEINERSHQQ